MKEFLLNFEGNQQYVGINIQGSDDTSVSGFFIKLLSPLPLDINENTECEIVEERSYPYQFEVTLEEEETQDSDINIEDIENTDGGIGSIDSLLDENGFPRNINLTGRSNFNLSTNRNRFSQYYTFSDITDNASDEDFARFLNSVSQSKADIDIDFTSFEDFIHFSSAKERFDNFVYKVHFMYCICVF